VAIGISTLSVLSGTVFYSQLSAKHQASEMQRWSWLLWVHRDKLYAAAAAAVAGRTLLSM